MEVDICHPTRSKQHTLMFTIAPPPHSSADEWGVFMRKTGRPRFLRSCLTKSEHNQHQPVHEMELTEKKPQYDDPGLRVHRAGDASVAHVPEGFRPRLGRRLVLTPDGHEHQPERKANGRSPRPWPKPTAGRSNWKRGARQL